LLLGSKAERVEVARHDEIESFLFHGSWALYNRGMKHTLAVALVLVLALNAYGQRMDTSVGGRRIGDYTGEQLFDPKQKLYLFYGGD
jgi:hypothetical protein